MSASGSSAAHTKSCSRCRPGTSPTPCPFVGCRFYFHRANEGHKLDMLARNPRVSYVISRYYGGPAELAAAMECHGHCESVIAEGRALIVEDDEGLMASMRTCTAFYGHDDDQHGDDLLGRTRMIIVDVEHMTARREYEDHKTDYWYWEPVSAS